MNARQRRSSPRRTAGKQVLSSAACLAAMASVALSAQAALDPSARRVWSDVSAYSDQPADPTQALQQLLDLPEANEGALELPGHQFLERNRSRPTT